MNEKCIDGMSNAPRDCVGCTGRRTIDEATLVAEAINLIP